jgi:XisH protein
LSDGYGADTYHGNKKLLHFSIKNLYFCLKMARDKIHTPVKEALIQEGWDVTDDPLYIKIGNLTVFVDLGAESFIRAEKGGKRIAVEVKTFSNPSFMTALYEAIGKYAVYRKALELDESDRTLYLAMPEDVYDRYSNEPLFIGSLTDENINLILFETDIEKITRWITR